MGNIGVTNSLKLDFLVKESKLVLSVKLDSLEKNKGFTGFWLETFSSCGTVKGLEMAKVR